MNFILEGKMKPNGYVELLYLGILESLNIIKYCQALAPNP